MHSFNTHSIPSFRDERGITLIELIVTVVILGILAMTILMRGIDLSNTAQAGACRSNQIALETAQRFYYAQSSINGNPSYADSLTALTPYLRDGEIPQCPSNGYYQLLDNGTVRCTVETHRR